MEHKHACRKMSTLATFKIIVYFYYRIANHHKKIMLLKKIETENAPYTLLNKK